MTGPLPALLAPLTVPAALVYGTAVRCRNRRYDRRDAERVDRPVISVGNVTAGGVGKTPFVRWAAEVLCADGATVVIAMRGYGARAGEAGDEEMEYRDHLPDVPVVANPDRVDGVRSFLREQPDVDVVLLDDGFQHRRIHRDLDLVLIDATRPGIDGALLPRGWLREPAAALRRADAVIVTRADGVDDALARRIERDHGRPPLAWSRHAWRRLEIHRGGAPVAAVDTTWLDGRRIATMIGTGHPDAVVAQARECGADVVVRIGARDHHRYTRGFLSRVRGRIAGVDAVLMTAKDWVKTRDLIDLDAWPVPIVVPGLELEIIAGAEPLRDLLRSTVHSARNARASSKIRASS